jgi:hypothetical protein
MEPPGDYRIDKTQLNQAYLGDEELSQAMQRTDAFKIYENISSSSPGTSKQIALRDKEPVGETSVITYSPETYDQGEYGFKFNTKNFME